MGVISLTLSERPVVDRDVSHYLNRELIPVVREMLRVLGASPEAFTWSSGAASLDVTRSADWSSDATLTQDSTLTLTNGFDGAQGEIWVKQDAVGGWALTVTAAGRTVLVDDAFTDTDPDPAPDAITGYRYLFVTVAGEACLYLGKRFLLEI